MHYSLHTNLHNFLTFLHTFVSHTFVLFMFSCLFFYFLINLFCLIWKSLGDFCALLPTRFLQLGFALSLPLFIDIVGNCCCRCRAVVRVVAVIAVANATLTYT